MKSTTAGSIRPLILDLGCCGLSAIQANIREYDLAHARIRRRLVHCVDDPGQANILIVAGRLLPACRAFLSDLYDQLASPKWVIAYGTCAISGALFDTLATDQVIPINMTVTGCPPHPDALYDALANLIQQEQR